MVVDYRETARTIAGEQYAGEVVLWKEMLQLAMRVQGVTVIEAMLDSLRKAEARDLGAGAKLWICAGAAELIDDEAKEAAAKVKAKA